MSNKHPKYDDDFYDWFIGQGGDINVAWAMADRMQDAWRAAKATVPDQPLLATSISSSNERPVKCALVPKEITQEMQHAYFDVIDKNLSRVGTDATFGRYASQREAYRAMLAAAPKPTERKWGVDWEQEARHWEAEASRLTGLLNTPELIDFMKAVPIEAAHQQEKWGNKHDGGKTPQDWFWLIGYLAGKALHKCSSGDTDKALHHTITTAAACFNWHAAMLGNTNMRPGIEPPEEQGRRS